MNNITDDIKELQMRVWLSMPPGERLYQALLHNTNLDTFWTSDKAKELAANFGIDWKLLVSENNPS